MTTTHNADLSYRPDIDGLRAIAVGIVVLFHARLGIFHGGYIGVDVFFVISGFLISSIIWRQLGAGPFKIGDFIFGFYERRIRRIFPALAVILLVTLVLGAWLFAPQDYFMLGRSAWATATFSSNFHFNSQSGYFAPGAETQPLLHTWSLAVEEQFYLVAPFFLILLARMQNRSRTLLFLALFAASLGVSSLGAFDESKAAFYLPQSRAFELMTGMALAIRLVPTWRNDALREAGAFVGLAMILGAALFYSDATPFPGLAALVPCVGTVLLISTAGELPTTVSRALSAAPIVMMGEISYSLYLWHWPLFVFAEYEYGERLPLGYRIGLIALAVGLSFVTYWFVEQPARRRTLIVSRRAVIGSGLAAMAVVGALSQGVIRTTGWPQRLSPDAAAFAELVRKSKVPIPCPDAKASASLPGCHIGAKQAKATFLLWGDSHAIALSARLSELATSRGLAGEAAIVGSCPPMLADKATSPRLHGKSKCAAMAQRVSEILKSEKFEKVIIAARWASYAEGANFVNGATQSNEYDSGNAQENRDAFRYALLATIKTIVATGRTVVVIGPVPEQATNPPNAMMRAKMRRESVEISLPYAEFEARERAVIADLSEAEAIPGTRVIYPHTVLCDEAFCKSSINGNPLYIDTNHLGTFGTKAIESLLASELDSSMPGAHAR